MLFWEISLRDYLWAKVRSLSILEYTNILFMVYNADDRDSFQNLFAIQREFQRINQVGAYQCLVSVIPVEIIQRQVPKIIKKAEAKAYIDHVKIPSYIEVRLDNGKHFD